MLLGFVLAIYFDYATQAKCHLILPIVFEILFARIPQSPQHLINVQKEKVSHLKVRNLERKTIYYWTHRRRRNRINFSLERKLKNSHLTRQRNRRSNRSWHWMISASQYIFIILLSPINSNLTIFSFYVPFAAEPRARKSILITLSLVCLNSVQGFTVLIAYVTEIFASTNSNLKPIESSLIITSLLIVANLIFCKIIDRAGRRILYVCSSLATSLAYVLFAIHLFFDVHIVAYEWVPIVSVSFIIFVASLGMGPVPFTVMMEIYPRKVLQNDFRSTNKFDLLTNHLHFCRFYITESPHSSLCTGQLDFSCANHIHRSKSTSDSLDGWHFLRWPVFATHYTAYLCYPKQRGSRMRRSCKCWIEI